MKLRGTYRVNGRLNLACACVPPSAQKCLITLLRVSGLVNEQHRRVFAVTPKDNDPAPRFLAAAKLNPTQVVLWANGDVRFREFAKGRLMTGMGRRSGQSAPDPILDIRQHRKAPKTSHGRGFRYDHQNQLAVGVILLSQSPI